MTVLGKQDIVDRISENTNLPKVKTAAVVNEFIKVITHAMECNDRVTIMGFGSWKVQHVAERVGRNPSTNESITIPEHNRVNFKAGKTLKLAAETSKIDTKKTRKTKQAAKTKAKAKKAKS